MLLVPGSEERHRNIWSKYCQIQREFAFLSAETASGVYFRRIIAGSFVSWFFALKQSGPSFARGMILDTHPWGRYCITSPCEKYTKTSLSRQLLSVWAPSNPT